MLIAFYSIVFYTINSIFASEESYRNEIISLS